MNYISVKLLFFKKPSFNMLASLTLSCLLQQQLFTVVFWGKQCMNLWCLKQVLYSKDIFLEFIRNYCLTKPGIVTQ